jgi:hypothetical protein
MLRIERILCPLALLGIFNRQLFHRLGLPFLLLAAMALLAGWRWMRRPDQGGTKAEQPLQPKNPLELGAASFEDCACCKISVCSSLLRGEPLYENRTSILGARRRGAPARWRTHLCAKNQD